MCHTEHVFHNPCHHWGRERLAPCCRSRNVNGSHTGCGYIENLGSINSNDWCPKCKYRDSQGGDWRPFALISEDGWFRVQEKLRQRSIVSDDIVRKGMPPALHEKTIGLTTDGREAVVFVLVAVASVAIMQLRHLKL